MFKDKTVNVFLQQLANHRQKGYQSIVTRVLAISWGLWYRDNRWYFPFLGDFPVSVLCMSVEFFSCTPSDGAAWSLLVGCIQQQHCCWPCSCTMLLGSILTPYSIVLCLCTFCGLYILFHILWPVYSVYSVARGCSMLNHILMTVMQWQIQHQVMRNSWFSPPSVVCSIYFSFHDRARGCLSFSSAATTQPLNCTLILDIHCWYRMYSLRLAPQWLTFTSNIEKFHSKLVYVGLAQVHPNKLK